MCVVCVSFRHPFLLFVGGSHGQGERHLQLSLPEPTSTSNEEAPRGRVKAVGPTGPSADQAGRPTGQWGQPTLACRAGLSSGPTCHWCVPQPLSRRFLALVGHLIHILTRVML